MIFNFFFWINFFEKHLLYQKKIVFEKKKKIDKRFIMTEEMMLFKDQHEQLTVCALNIYAETL